jgi:outer membrane protein W
MFAGKHSVEGFGGIPWKLTYSAADTTKRGSYLSLIEVRRLLGAVLLFGVDPRIRKSVIGNLCVHQAQVTHELKDQILVRENQHALNY